jgi:hypothetical protein
MFFHTLKLGKSVPVNNGGIKMFRKSKFLVILMIIIVPIAVTAAAPSSRFEVVYFGPSSSEVDIGPGQIGVFRWGWVCCTRGLTSDWVSATEQRYVLKQLSSGEVIQVVDEKEASRHWGRIETHNKGTLTPDRCVWSAWNTWVSFWRYEKLKLNKSGDYILEVHIHMGEPLIDGFDLDGDGYADAYDEWVTDTEVIIHLER